MESEQHPIAKMLDGRGVGIIRSLGTHFSLIEFDDGGTRWKVYVENDEFEIIGHINIGRKIVE